MLSIDKNGRTTITVEEGFEDAWKGATWYYAYISKQTFWELRISFVEDLYPTEPRKIPEALRGKDILGHFRTDERGRFSPNVFMKKLPGKVNYTEWGEVRDEFGCPQWVKRTDMGEILKGLLDSKKLSILDLVELIDRIEK